MKKKTDENVILLASGGAEKLWKVKSLIGAVLLDIGTGTVDNTVTGTSGLVGIWLDVGLDVELVGLADGVDDELVLFPSVGSVDRSIGSVDCSIGSVDCSVGSVDCSVG